MARTPDDRPHDDIPPGVQPEEDGRLLCLECGRWYRGLGQHVVFSHEMTAGDYRRIHELPATFGLQASDLKQWRSETMIAKFQDPEVRAAFKPHRSSTELLAMAQEARSESRSRAGSRAAHAETVRLAVESRRRKSEDRLDALALAAGYADIHDLLEQHPDATSGALGKLIGVDHKSIEYLRARLRRADVEPVGEPALAGPEARLESRALQAGYADVATMLDETRDLHNRELAELLGRSETTVSNLRREHGVSPPGRWAGESPLAHPTHAAPLPAELWRDLPAGEQPSHRGALVCRECGRQFRALAWHLRHHDLTATSYRLRHGLPLDLPLRVSRPTDQGSS